MIERILTHLGLAAQPPPHTHGRGAWNFFGRLDTRTRSRWEGSACARASVRIAGNQTQRRAKLFRKQRGLRELSRS